MRGESRRWDLALLGAASASEDVFISGIVKDVDFMFYVNGSWLHVFSLPEGDTPPRLLSARELVSASGEEVCPLVTVQVCHLSIMLFSRPGGNCMY
jgi:hypothetical protein